jgi:hypothetical protein
MLQFRAHMTETIDDIPRIRLFIVNYFISDGTGGQVTLSEVAGER